MIERRLIVYGIVFLIVLAAGMGVGYYVTHNYWTKKWDREVISQQAAVNKQLTENAEKLREEKKRADKAEDNYAKALARLDALAHSKPPAPILHCKPNSSPVSRAPNASSKPDGVPASRGVGYQSDGFDIDPNEISAVAWQCDRITERLRCLQYWADPKSSLLPSDVPRDCAVAH